MNIHTCFPPSFPKDKLDSHRGKMLYLELDYSVVASGYIFKYLLFFFLEKFILFFINFFIFIKFIRVTVTKII